MLLRFRAANVYSFRDQFELDLRPRKRAESGSQPEAARVTAIYGANASGKSNLLKAMSWMATAVRRSGVEWVPNGGVPRPLFKLDSAARGEASLFEAEFLTDGIRYVYGFEVSDERVETEWLYEYATGRRRTLFVRDADTEDEYDFKGRQLKGELDQMTRLTRPNALFVSMGAQLNNPQLARIFEWFQSGLVRAESSGPGRLLGRWSSTRAEDWFADVEPLLASADIGVVEGTIVETEMLVELKRSDLATKAASPERIVYQELRLQHRGAEGSVDLGLDEESAGTVTWLSTTRTVLGALRAGSVVLHDELDASLHPALVAEVLRVFRDPKANPRGAQLICTLHDVSLLGSAHADAPLDRREVWITEKDSMGRSELYPLTDAHPATQENLERGYLRGRYGGVPRVGAGWLAMDVAKLLNDSDAPADVEGE